MKFVQVSWTDGRIELGFSNSIRDDHAAGIGAR
jgi:hypothetical protein